MKSEKLSGIDWRRHGTLAFTRLKEWWSFEGLDDATGFYFVFLAMKSSLTDYVSLSAIDFRNDRRVDEEHMSKVSIVGEGKKRVRAGGKWGTVSFEEGDDSEWNLEVHTDSILAAITESPRSPVHNNRLLTRRIDYNISQVLLTGARGTIDIGQDVIPFDGKGYFENCWGVQARQSTANWLHFWSGDAAGVLLDCYYDEGVHHHYCYLWDGSAGFYLPSPLSFGYDPSDPKASWKIGSPRLELEVSHLDFHHTHKRIPPVLPYVKIDYDELLVAVTGRAETEKGTLAVDGIGKYDHNFNLW